MRSLETDVTVQIATADGAVRGTLIGTAWRVLRLPSITDQIFIKAQRIRSIQEKGVQKVDEDITGEFVAIVNYCVIALMQVKLQNDPEMKMPDDMPFDGQRMIYAGFEPVVELEKQDA